MPDIFTKRKRSEVMSRVCGKGNRGTELRLMQIFRAHEITGWRRGSELPGRPDFVLPKLKLAVFVDGCFWHGCPKHVTWPKTRAAFWQAKITRNKERDKEVGRALRKLGWKVARIWEHELSRKNETRLLSRLNSHLGQSA